MSLSFFVFRMMLRLKSTASLRGHFTFAVAFSIAFYKFLRIAPLIFGAESDMIFSLFRR